MINYYEQFFWISTDKKSVLHIRLKESYEQLIQQKYRCLLLTKNETYIVLFTKTNSNLIQDNQLIHFQSQSEALTFIENEINQIIEANLFKFLFSKVS